LYQYSFSVGNTERKLLYEGRDFQHYFNLPSGDPNDNYKGTKNPYLSRQGHFTFTLLRSHTIKPRLYSHSQNTSFFHSHSLYWNKEQIWSSDQTMSCDSDCSFKLSERLILPSQRWTRTVRTTH